MLKYCQFISAEREERKNKQRIKETIKELIRRGRNEQE
jgi:hypothetical protein